MMSADKTVDDFLHNKSEHTKALFHRFITEYNRIGTITLYPAKTMIGIANDQKRIAWITQLGKNFVHVVFPFKKSYTDNLCFQKIAQVPGEAKQFNHHFRMYNEEDINEEIIYYMKMAYHLEK